MPAQIASVDVVRILGKLSDDGGEQSSRNRFIKEYLSKYKSPESIINDIEGLLDAYPTFEGDLESLARAFADLVNRLAEISGFSVDYVKYSGREKITGIWKVGEDVQIRVAAIICTSFEEAKGVARNALLILPEATDLGRPFVTVERLGMLFSMIEQIELPVSSIASILVTDDDYDKRISSFMELMFLAFKKELARKPQMSLQKEWTKEELQEFIMERLKLPTIGMLFSLLDSPMAGEDLVENINEFLKENESELVKGPMALGAIMGALSKHYSGIKEELVLREGKKYRLAEKYKPMISEIKTRFESSKQTVDR
ncbi:MAG TPA: hypothetical protein DIT26_02435 [Mesotoga infera]|jgi:hypothetical protein|uniref:Uncharacterized protein n=1 Tax=Mesotoga infera TaxID=1236046 RepID=A0A101I5J2_9BACT|nr:MAG: Uncharacterized protein XD86_0907 [Mesotoga infera]KUK89133.1 MAG: Uncharacterized protein XE02_1166 [Mesotoga infera]HCO69434.1 hypothetical protein [Mesotoga infera]